VADDVSDDVLLLADSPLRAAAAVCLMLKAAEYQAALDELCRLLNSLGFTVSAATRKKPTQDIIFLGIRLRSNADGRERNDEIVRPPSEDGKAMAPQEQAAADDASDDVLLLADSPLRAAAAVCLMLKARAITSFRLMMGSVTRQCVECQLLMAGILCGFPALPKGVEADDIPSFEVKNYPAPPAAGTQGDDAPHPQGQRRGLADQTRPQAAAHHGAAPRYPEWKAAPGDGLQQARRRLHQRPRAPDAVQDDGSERCVRCTQ
jgi:hypothetical protein